MSDLFHPSVPSDFVARVFDVMRDTPQHRYLILTKRPDRMARWTQHYYPHAQPYPNVWLGTSVENEKVIGRVPVLLTAIAAVRFLSCEPLLGYVNLRPYLNPTIVTQPIDWVILGGESGAEARPCDVHWLSAMIADCQQYDVPVFVKQLGEVWARQFQPTHDDGALDTHAGNIACWPMGLRVRQWPRVAMETIDA